MRIAIGQLWQETNTLNPLPTTRADFEEFGVCRGAELVERMADVNELGGFIQSLRRWPEQPEIVGLVRLPAWPSGTATADTFAWLRAEMLAAVEAALPVDGVLLALHGALAAEEHPDAEGDIVAAIRDRIGPHTPLVATLDLHANVTAQLVHAADVLVTYHSMPHVDIYETGERAAAVLRRILVDHSCPVTAFQKIPAVVPPENSSTEGVAGVAVELKQRLVELEADPGILSAGLAPVQPWLDIPELGSSVLVTTDADPDLAVAQCASLANEFWRRRREYLPELVAVDEAVRRARQLADHGLVVLSDAADATTSGAPGDSVWILAELLKYDWPRPVLVTVVAAELVTHAAGLGAGAELTAQLGGRRDTRFGTRISITANVQHCFEAKFMMTGHIGKNMPIDMGRSVVLRKGNLHLIVTSRSGPHFAPELFRAAGLDPFAAAVLVAKSPCGFRAVYQDRAHAVFSVQAPGCAPSDFWNYPFQNIHRPLWPWDEFEGWTARPTKASAQK